MTQQAIFGPFFAMMFLTLVVWVYMYVRRIGFLTRNNIRPDEVASPEALARVTPPAVSTPSDNLKNLFELPVLFYALTLYLFVTSQVDAVYVYAGWIFVASPSSWCWRLGNTSSMADTRVRLSASVG